MARSGNPKTPEPGTASLQGIDRPQGLANPRLGWNSDAIAEMLRRLDLKFMALVPGASYRGFHDSVVNYLGNTNPQMLVCLHEEHTVAIAHGYAKVTDRPMAVALHTNVGLMHATMAIFNAWCDRKPMIIIGANGPLDAEARRPWIEWIHSSADQAHIIRDYIKWDDTPHSVPAAMESLLRANQIARTAPFGPTYVCLDEKLQQGAIEGEVAFPDPARFEPGKPAAPRAEDIRRIADVMIAAERPLIMMGRVSRDAEAWEKRVRLAEALGAVVFTDLHNAAAFPSNHPLHVLEPRFHPRDQHLDAFKRADAVLSLDWLDLGGYVKRLGGPDEVPAWIVHASVDSYSHRGWSMDYQILPTADLRILATPDMVIHALLDELEARGQAAPQAQKLALVDENPEKTAPARTGAMALRDMALVWREFQLGHDDVSMVNMPLGWPGDCVPIRGPLDYLGSNGGAGVGAGPGHGVGAALALKGTGRLPAALLGDGDFAMGASAIWTASHMDLALLIVVANNRAYFNDVVHQEQVARDRGRPVENKWIGQGIDEPCVDIPGLARSFGFETGSVEDSGALLEALEEAAAHVAAGGRYLLDVRIEPGYAE
ncbi:MAG: thiamine pyrophosphate-binding protein [Alphaproteobacteria bacterium]|nr:thiamine pyrophosphate-binding protein [Alphaproteobacteria bacterium]